MQKLIGFDEQFNILKSKFISRNLHSSIIIHGSKGIGKKYFIIKFIDEILNINFKNNNYLHHTNLLKNNTHPNIKILEKIIDHKTKKLKSNITIDQVRQIKKFVSESSSIKNFSKILIIDSGDDLNKSSANSLLKILEEPNENLFIFLISHQLSSLLPTIRSRCLKIKLQNHNYDNFRSILFNHLTDIGDDEINFYFDLTNGSPGDAISLYNSNILEIIDLTITSLVNNKIDKNSINLVNSLSKLDNENFKSYISVLKTILTTLNKLKIKGFDPNSYLSEKFKMLNNLSKMQTNKNIIDRFEYLSTNENDLFTYNLDKKLFMLKFLTI